MFDSDVMFDPYRRYCLLSLVDRLILSTRWSQWILDEWSHVIVRAGRVTIEQGRRQREQLAAAFPEAMCTVRPDHETTAASLVHDPGDCRVAACALTVAPCTLVTLNVRDFDVRGLQARGVVVRKPSPWLAELYSSAEIAVQRDWLIALDAHRVSLRSPSFTPAEYVEVLASRQLKGFVAAIREAFLLRAV